MKNKIVVLDFDGTLTQVKEEAKPFLKSFKKDYANFLSKDNLDKEWEEIEKEILKNPEQYGWKDKGLIIAPAKVDDYILASVVAQVLLDKYDVFKKDKERDEIVHQIFRQNYLKSKICFKKEAKEVLEKLIKKLPVFIVTNSRPDAVLNKIQVLNPLGKEKLKIFGEAQKNWLDANFDLVPEFIKIQGLERKIYLRRKRYYDVLNQIWEQSSVKPEQCLIVGDVFELDLVLPAKLGCNIFLITNSQTPDYEKQAVKDLFKGYVSEDIRDILKVI